ncbi:MAG: MraY family glycosyltransferase [Candidatus Muiribacteriota bacterium]
MNKELFIDKLMLFLSIFIIQIILFYIIKMLNFTDKPDERKIHKTPKLTMGGALFILPFLIFGGNTVLFRNIFVSCAFLLTFFAGMIDDIKRLSPKIKLFTQLLTGLFLFYGGVKISVFFGVDNYYLSLFLTVFYFTSFINIINLIDGADGLATLICSIIITGIFFITLNTSFNSDIYLVLILSLGGFLFFNIKNSLIFMGDLGSNFLGLIIGIMLIDAGFHSFSMNNIFSFILIIFVPFTDTFIAILRRLKNKKSVFAADKNHIHHILLEKFSLNVTLIILCLLQGIMTVIGIILHGKNL